MNIKGSGRAGGAIIGISNSSSSHHHRAASIPEEEEYSERDYYDSDDHSIVTDASSFHLTTTIKNDHITIFQAAPLAGMNGQGNLGAIQTLDLAQERQQLTRIFANTRVAVEFQIATHETLGKFLETKQGTILHFSCHGDAGQLFLEDDWGGLAPLAKEHLKKWVQLGGRELQFVFVSACYSQSIGQAFVDAGVPHVICSREDAKLMVGVSALFEKTFYRNLAEKKTVQESFNIAKEATLANPKIPEELRRREVEKYCLLGKGRSGNGDHNEPVFFQQPQAQQQRSPQPSPRRPAAVFPPPPKVFIGRAVDQYRILQLVKQSRLTCIHGPSGMGKTALIKAVCQYIHYRMPMMDLTDIQWVDTSQDRLLMRSEEQDWQPIIDLIHDNGNSNHATTPPTSNRQFLQQAGEHMIKLVETFQHRKTLLVVDAKRIHKKDSLQKLGIFLEEFVNGTHNVKVIVIYREEEDIKTSKLRLEHQVYSVGPLTFEWSARLFAKYFPEQLLKERHYGIGTKQELCEVLVPSSNLANHHAAPNATTAATATPRQQMLWNMMGGGDPRFTVDVAKTFTKEQYSDLLILCANKDDNDLTLDKLLALDSKIEEIEKRKDVYERLGNGQCIEQCRQLLNVLDRQKEAYSRARLERRQKELQKEYDTAYDNEDYAKALEIEHKQQHLEAIKVRLPTLIQLENQREELEFQIKLARNKDLLRAQQLQKDLKFTIKAINAERNGFGDTDIPESRALLEARIQKMDAEVKSCVKARQFSKAKELKPEIDRLKEMRSMVPSAADFRIRITSLNASLDKAIEEEDYASAETLQHRIEAIEAKLRAEEEAEKSYGVQVSIEKIPADEKPAAAGVAKRRTAVDPGDDPVTSSVHSTATTASSDPPGVALRTESRRSDPLLEGKKGTRERYSASDISLRPPARNALQTIVPSAHDSVATQRHSNQQRHSQSSQASRRPDPSNGASAIGPGAYAVRGNASSSDGDIDDDQVSSSLPEEPNPAPVVVAQSAAVERDIVLPIMATSSALPSALQVVDDIMEDQERLEQQIVEIMKRHAVQAESVVPVPEPGSLNRDISVDFSEYSDSARDTSSLRESLESEEKKGGMKALFKKLRNRKN